MFSKFVLASVAAAALLAASVRAEDPSLVTKNGDLHISVGDTKGKVYVKSADGTTIELFDLAARLKAIETAIPDIKGEIEGNTKDIETKFTALDGTLNGVKSIVDQNVKANADKIKTLDDNAKKSADAMKVCAVHLVYTSSPHVLLAFAKAALSAVPCAALTRCTYKQNSRLEKRQKHARTAALRTVYPKMCRRADGVVCKKMA